LPEFINGARELSGQIGALFLAWDDGGTNTVQHNDRSEIERALVKV
jgi:hypothetical protein